MLLSQASGTEFTACFVFWGAVTQARGRGREDSRLTKTLPLAKKAANFETWIVTAFLRSRVEDMGSTSQNQEEAESSPAWL